MSTFGQSIRDFTAEMQSVSEQLFFTVVRVDRVLSVEHDGTGGLDVELLDPVYFGPDVAPHYGRIKAQSFRPYEQDRDIGGAATVIQQRYDIHFPVGVGPVLVGDIVTVIESPTNPLLVGNVYRVAGPHEKTLQTAQRVLADHAPQGLTVDLAQSILNERGD